MVQKCIVPIILVIGSFVLSFVVLECAFRFLPQNSVNRYQSDSVFGHSRIPSSSGRYVTQEFDQFVRFNEDGFRGKDFPRAKGRAIKRVVVLGDSYVEGIQVSEAEVFSAQLEAQLLSHQAVEVFNMGISGYGTVQQALLLEKTVLAYKPDLVVLGFVTSNDIRNNSLMLEQRTRDYAQAMRPYLVLDETMPEKSKIIFPSAQGLAKVSRNGIAYFLLDNSSLIRFFHKRFSQVKWGADILSSLGLISKSAKNALHGIPTDYLIYKKHEDPDWKEGWKVTEYALQRIQNVLEAQKINFLVVIFTNAEQIDHTRWEKVLEERPHMQEESWDLALPQQKLRSILSRLNIPYVDLLASFKQNQSEYPNRALHYSIDGHWTAAGHALAAEQTASYIQENTLLLR